MATQKQLLECLYGTYLALDRKEKYNEVLSQKNIELAKKTEEGKQYLNAVEKYKKIQSKNVRAKNIITAILISAVSIAVLIAVIVFSFNTVMNNINEILSIESPSQVWTNQQYVVLYTLGILMATSIILGLLISIIYSIWQLKNLELLAGIYFGLGVLAYLVAIVYSFIEGDGLNKIMGLLLIIVIPRLLIFALFNFGGVREQMIALWPTIIPILIALILLGIIFIVVYSVVKLCMKNIKLGNGKLTALKKERDSLYPAYKKQIDKFNETNKPLDTFKDWNNIRGYISSLGLSESNSNVTKVGQLLWCIENNYAADIISANNWLYNDANRRRAEAEAARFRAGALNRLDDINTSIKNLELEVNVDVSVSNTTNISVS